ncbi:MAG TPA: hypothetical protein VLH79_13930, partial [Chthonomonadales bacterium]|nr:hypothetical protein [Chthonomonadales bacterium]
MAEPWLNRRGADGGCRRALPFAEGDGALTRRRRGGDELALERRYRGIGGSGANPFPKRRLRLLP